MVSTVRSKSINNYALTQSSFILLEFISLPCFHDADFEILAFPCNQFAGQEPGNNEEIVEFACTRFKAEYPIFDKVSCSMDFNFLVTRLIPFRIF